MTVVLNVLSSEEPTYTLISYLEGIKNTTNMILLYTYSEYWHDFIVLILVNYINLLGNRLSIIKENS
jgi:hypothetical protein